MPPDPVNTEKPERWTIYVCEECGDYGLVFGSEHSIPLSCPEPGEDDPAGRHKGPYREVPVIPASSVVELEAENERLKEALKGIELHADIPAGEPWSEAYAEVANMARSALHPEPTEENG